MTGRIYVGNLPIDIRESELDDLFYKYGRIREIDLKTPARPPAFAFISFDDSRDAQDAIRGRDGYNFDGYRLRVEFSKGRGGGRDEPAARRGGGRRSDYGVVVSNLPRGCSWQDLKDFMRKIGDVVFSDVERNGEGVVEFSNRDDMERAIRNLDDTEFKSYTDSSYIRVRAAGGSKRDRSRSDDRDVKRDSRGRGSGRDRSVSRSRSRSRSHSRSRSPSRDRSRSRSRSLSRERKPRAHSEDEGNGAVKEEEPVRMNSEEDVQEPVRKNSEEDVQEQEPEKKEEVVEQE